MNIKAYQRGDVILDTYLVEDIRSGAMGNVYIADHKKWKIKVAIKAPNEKILSDKQLHNMRSKISEMHATGKSTRTTINT
jgi:hypothetical protein